MVPTGYWLIFSEHLDTESMHICHSEMNPQAETVVLSAINLPAALFNFEMMREQQLHREGGHLHGYITYSLISTGLRCFDMPCWHERFSSFVKHLMIAQQARHDGAGEGSFVNEFVTNRSTFLIAARGEGEKSSGAA